MAGRTESVHHLHCSREVQRQTALTVRAEVSHRSQQMAAFPSIISPCSFFPRFLYFSRTFFIFRAQCRRLPGWLATRADTVVNADSGSGEAIFSPEKNNKWSHNEERKKEPARCRLHSATLPHRFVKIVRKASFLLRKTLGFAGSPRRQQGTWQSRIFFSIVC